VTKVKICGIRRLEDAMHAVALGADALGFVFWPSSPRFIEPESARPIVESLPPFVTPVGVFVDQPFDYVFDVATGLRLGTVQLHGHETPESYAGMPCRVIKAVAVAEAVDVEGLAAAVPDRATVLLDAHDPVKRGGTGRTINWERASVLARQRPVILSGGLNADNVHIAIDLVRPYAVDVSSGVESAPGVKDRDKLRALFTAISGLRTDLNL
jgi:phosphoribosylanthranilate isomerase